MAWRWSRNEQGAGRKAWGAGCLLLAVLCLSPKAAGGADGAQGWMNLSYRISEQRSGDETESSWQKQQEYRIMMTKELSPKVRLNGNLDLMVNDVDGKRELSLAPDLRLNVSNEYFDASSGYRITERNMDVELLGLEGDADHTSAQSWNMNLRTKSLVWPRFRFAYGEDRNWDHREEHKTDSFSSQFSGSAEYDWRMFDMHYNFRRNLGEDHVTDLTRTTYAHDGKLGFRKTFLDGGLRTSGSYGATWTTTRTEAGAKPVEVDDELAVLHGLYAAETPNPGVYLDVLDGLTDGDTQAATGADLGGSRGVGRNLGLQLVLDSKASRIRVYTEDTDFVQEAFAWDVHASDDGLSWDTVASGAVYEYDEDDRCFIISFPATEATWFKVVNTSNDPLANSIPVTEIEIFEVTEYEAGTDETSERFGQTMQASLSWQPLDWMTLGYDFAGTTQDSSPDGQFSAQYGQTANCRVEQRFADLFDATGLVQRRMDSRSAGQNSVMDNFAVHLAASPLDTLDTSLSLTHSLYSQAEFLQSMNSAALLQTVARLREGADLSLDLSMDRFESVSADSVTWTKAVEANLRMQLTRALGMEVEQSVDFVDYDAPDGGSSEQDYAFKATAHLRPSRYLYLKGVQGVEWGEGAADWLQQYNLTWIMTSKMQMSLGYALDMSQDTQHTFSLDYSWKLSRICSVGVGVDWNRVEADGTSETRSIMMEMSARF